MHTHVCMATCKRDIQQVNNEPSRTHRQACRHLTRLLPLFPPTRPRTHTPPCAAHRLRECYDTSLLARVSFARDATASTAVVVQSHHPTPVAWTGAVDMQAWRTYTASCCIRGMDWRCGYASMAYIHSVVLHAMLSIRRSLLGGKS
jgi:hypothetical protein